MNSIIVTPISNIGRTHKTGGLHKVSRQKIETILGFAPNAEDDPDKVTASWAFDVYLPSTGEHYPCAVWDYRGSFGWGAASCYGNPDALAAVFGEHYTGY